MRRFKRASALVRSHAFAAHVTALVGATTLLVTLAILAWMVMQPLATSYAAGDPNASLREAIVANYQQGVIPPGYQVAAMNSSQQAALKNHIVTELERHFTGTFLTGRIADLQQWADAAATRNVPHLVDVRLKDYQVDSMVVTGNTAIATGSYVIYLKDQAKGDDKGHDVTWGGTATYSFAAQLQKVDSQWLVSSLYSRQTNYVEDPAAKSGWEYLPSDAPPALTTP